ncbi:MAG: hypothetical protein ACNS61_09000 [Candidatus Wenzhouxiangella sp. M2_3B_020]
MLRTIATIARPLLLAALPAAVAAQDGAYTLEFSGAVEGSYEGAATDVDHVEYTTFGSSASNSSGPYKVVLQVPDAQVFGSNGAASVTLTINGPVPPGEYPIGVDTDDGATVAGVVYSDSEIEQLDFNRARFGVREGATGMLRLERFDREAITGTFEFAAANHADPPEMLEVRGSFTNLEYSYDSEIDVTGTGPFAAMPTGFNEASAQRIEGNLRITLGQQMGPDLVFTVPSAQSGRVQLGPDEPGRITFGAEAGTGSVALIRLGTDTVGGSFEVEVSYQGQTGTLEGEFDYVPLARD